MGMLLQPTALSLEQVIEQRLGSGPAVEMGTDKVTPCLGYGFKFLLMLGLLVITDLGLEVVERAVVADVVDTLFHAVVLVVADGLPQIGAAACHALNKADTR